ncbi:MAG: hypothetical protein ACPGNT_09545 [Rhodospirillales bacterium]
MVVLSKTGKRAALLTAGFLAAGIMGASQAVQAQQASPYGDDIRLEIVVFCSEDAAEFRVQNMGGTWPKSAKFQLLRVQDQTVLSTRQLRLSEGQKASFKIKNSKGGKDNIGMFIDPSWYVRAFQYDATVDCRTS